MQWITRERPKIDRIAFPRLIDHIIKEKKEIQYMP